MPYTPLFDPKDATAALRAAQHVRLGDRGPKSVYVYDERIRRAVNVALAAGRPLLVSGEAGTGKTSLATDVASKLGWRLLTRTVSSRTEARDLLFTFDAVRRLADAQAGEKFVKPDAAYLEPGVLWWAFDRGGAARRGAGAGDPGVVPAVDPSESPAAERAVVLLDEIDKADPDVPNDLLEPLGSYRFRVPGLAEPVRAAKPPLVVITTNDERDLPRAFVRRCIGLALDPPTPPRLVAIARAHDPDADGDLLEDVSSRFFEMRKQCAEARTPAPGTAEYLDAVNALATLGLEPSDPDWITYIDDVLGVSLWKNRSPRSAAPVTPA